MKMWEMVKNIRELTDIQNVVDVGSHVGGFCENPCLRFLPDSNYSLFEPTAYNFKKLTTKFNSHSNIKCFNYAVGNRDIKDIDFFVEEESEGMFNGMGNTLILDVRPKHARNIQKIDVITLDTAFSRGFFEIPDFLKIDAQGNDLQVVQGSENILPKIKFILMELQTNNLSDAFGYMESKGWKIYNISMEKGWSTPKGRLGESNFMFYNSNVLKL